ncbi:hypothetical protein HF324_04780 [Chitinophaga oryzae]|uniref:PH domain-containing protein n=1 Tax=Chitinophaga oryzae TaxID=2725414 RepID=A0ABX6LAU6_9BACT|nr:hypothetical protein [Chitinophaga oryzae]QJB37203.1 hypothetical protein HF324_04780 [Chitinophaga oryzae]
MNKKETILPLITDRNFHVLRLLTWFGLLFLCLSFFILFRGYKISFLIFLSISILLLNANYIIKEYSVVGNIYLLPDKIVVKPTVELEMKYILEDLKDIEVFILGVKGEFYGGRAITTKTGVDNSIVFQYLGESKSIRFLLKQQQVSQLSEILQIWQLNGVKFKLHNQSRERFI